MYPPLIAVHGQKHSGKGEIAKALRFHNYRVIKFATPLKNMVRSLLRDAGILEEEIERYIEGDLKEVPIPEVEGATARYLMQTLGVEWRDLISNHLFARICARRVINLLKQGNRLVIDDLRFPAEKAAIDELVAPVMLELFREGHRRPIWWRIQRPSIEAASDSHASERPLDGSSFDHTFVNDYTLKALHLEVDRQLIKLSR